MLVVNLESTHKPVKPPRNYLNHPQITQTTNKPSTNQPKHAQTTRTTHKPSTNQPIYPQTSQTTHKPATNNQLYQKNTFSDNAKHVLRLELFYAIKLPFSIEDQSRVRIDGK